jgi:hypothetical protein
MDTSGDFAPIGIMIGVGLGGLALFLFFGAPPEPTFIAAGIGVSAWSLYYLLQYSAVLVYEDRHRSRASEATIQIRASYTGRPSIGLIKVDGEMPRWMSIIRGLAIACLVTFWISVIAVIVLAQAAKNS